MVFNSASWKDLIAGEEFRSLCGLAAIDEAHCVRWSLVNGDKKTFREAWGWIGEIHALLSRYTPLLAVSATIDDKTLGLVKSTMGFQIATRFVNLANDWSDIFMECQTMNYSIDSTQKIVWWRNSRWDPSKFSSVQRLPGWDIYFAGILSIDTGGIENFSIPPVRCMDNN